MVEIT